MYLQLDLLQYQADLVIAPHPKGGKQIFDPIRRKHLVLTPEELLRQLVLQDLLQRKGFPRSRIRVEHGIKINDRVHRCDIVVFDRAAKPWLLIECKSAKVPLTQKTFEQSARYNMVLQVPFMAITNGMNTVCCALDTDVAGGGVVYMEDWPT
jgi:Type I restriction enzyme R protein N terminus (HSDR_N)